MANGADEGRSLRGLFGLGVGPVLAGVLLVGPRVGWELEAGRPELNAMAAVAVLMAVWWITEAIPIAATGLLPLALFPLLSIMPAKDAALAYGSSLLFLFLGGFLVALAIEESGLHRRVALGIVAAVGDGPRRLVLGFMLATWALSMWLSNTATAMMLLPIGMSVIQQIQPEGGGEEVKRRFGAALMLGIAYSASIGGFATLVGTPPNVAFKQIYRESFDAAPEITFGGWMLVALPLSVAMLLAAWTLLVMVVFRMESASLLGGGNVIAERRRALGPITSAERRTAVVFLTTAALWIFREPVPDWGWAPALGVGRSEGGSAMVDDATVAMLMAAVCFVLPAGALRGRPLLTWEATVRVPWGILMLFGGGLALARGLKQSGLDVYLGQAFGDVLEGQSLLAMTAATAAAMTFFTELTSNLAGVQMCLPILARVAERMDCDPRLLMVAATWAASCAFMLPVATPPNAIVFGSGQVRMGDMIKAGIWLNVLGTVLIVAFAFLVAVPVLGIQLDGLPEWAASSAE